MTLKELCEKCKGKEDYKIIVWEDNSEGWYEIGDYITIYDEEKEICLHIGDLA